MSLAAPKQAVSPGRAVRSADKRASAALTCVLLGSLACLFVPVFREIVHKWLSDEYSAHGIFIPFMVGALLWWKRKEMRAIPIEPNAWGFALLVVGLGLNMAAWHLRLLVLTAFSIIPILLGLSLLLAGARMTRLLAFPVVFLFFVTPLPRWFVQPVSLPIQTVSAKVAFAIVKGGGIPLREEGFSVALPKVTVEVAESCSGFKKSFSLIVFASFYAALFSVAWWRKATLVVMSLPIALLANIVRVVALIIAGYCFGSRGVHAFHDFSEFVVLGICIVLLVAVGRGLGCRNLRYMA